MEGFFIISALMKVVNYITSKFGIRTDVKSLALHFPKGTRASYGNLLRKKVIYTIDNVNANHNDGVVTIFDAERNHLFSLDHATYLAADRAHPHIRKGIPPLQRWIHFWAAIKYMLENGE